MSIVEYSETQAALALLREKHAGPFEVTTTAGMKTAKAARAELRGVRVALEAKRVEVKAPAWERCKEIDSEANRIEAAILAIEEPIDAAIKAEEARKAEEKARAEAERVALAKEARELCDTMRAAVTAFATASSAEISEGIESLMAETFPENEHTIEVNQTRSEVVAAMGRMFVAAAAREKEAARMAEERAELERVKAESDRVAKIEQERIAAEAQAAREKIAAEEARAKAARDEADRVARVERDRLEAEARAARAEQDRQAMEARAAEEARQRVAREAIEAEQAKQRKEREAAEAIARAKRDEIEAHARAIEAERVFKMGARAMLTEFVRVYGKLPEFEGVVEAIKQASRSADWNDDEDEEVVGTTGALNFQARGL